MARQFALFALCAIAAAVTSPAHAEDVLTSLTSGSTASAIVDKAGDALKNVTKDDVVDAAKKASSQLGDAVDAIRNSSAAQAAGSMASSVIDKAKNATAGTTKSPAPSKSAAAVSSSVATISVVAIAATGFTLL